MPNRLAASASPYLLQHQDNPVEWYEWGPDAFAEATRRGVPILLSVGYSSCHWCHVMAHESFEDPETAADMNRWFVNIKVDREERPDVDAIYMTAVQAMTGQGGWPMTVWLTPEARPFYAGTYFPSDDRPGMPSFRRVLLAIAEAWADRREGVLRQAEQITAAIDHSMPPSPRPPGPDVPIGAYHSLLEAFDAERGGFGGAPKFPQQPALEFLLSVASRPWAPEARTMVDTTLRAMAEGGIRDHIDGGFARYSVDATWLVPHFEKMLYDNAQLARLYLWAGQEFDNDSFTAIALETLEYLRRDLRHPDGGFYSAEDADADGVEGSFSVWTFDEFMEVTGADGHLAARYFDVTRDGNFEGANILTRHTALEDLETDEIDGAAVHAALGRAVSALRERRNTRVRPGLDDKVVAEWNGLAIQAFAEAGAALNRPDLIADSVRCARFVLDRMTDPDGRLHRTWTRGSLGPDGVLADHAAVAVGLFSLYEATGDIGWFRVAEEITSDLTGRFGDETGLFATAHDAEELIVRPRDLMDNPHPSGNSLAADALIRLSLFTGDASYRQQADTAIRAATPLAERHPAAVGHLLTLLASIEHGLSEVAVVGPDGDRLAGPIRRRYTPWAAVAVSLDGSGSDEVPLLRDRVPARSGTLAYVCRGFVCDSPVEEPAALAALIT